MGAAKTTQLNRRLLHAAELGDCQAIEEALAGGARVAPIALQKAALGGHESCVRRLIPLTDPLDSDSLALRWAAGNGHSACVSLLIPVSDPLAQDSLALRWSAEAGHALCVRLLLPFSDARADNSQALYWAAHYGNAECVALLLPQSDPTAIWGEESTAAEVARNNGFNDIANMIDAFAQARELAAFCGDDALRALRKPSL